MKILIVVPSFKIIGGVSNHYLGLDQYWTNEVIYSYQGKRPRIPAIITFVPDLFRYVYELLFKDSDIVIINPSLTSYLLIRDGIYLLLAKICRKKVITFIHGWHECVAESIIKRPKLFRWVYGKSTFVYCLYSKFRDSLKLMGLKCPIVLTTTKVPDALVSNFDPNYRTGSIKKLLFLARIEKDKGVFIVLEMFELLKRRYPYLTLTICGTGSVEKEAIEYVKKFKLSDVYFTGSVSGKSLIDSFTQSDLYILPTLREGMATSVLEAMAFGLPVISRPVGGVNDFFEQGKMGYLIESLTPSEYVKIVDSLIENPDLVKSISINNYKYARTHFYASSVCAAIERDIKKYCKIN